MAGTRRGTRGVVLGAGAAVAVLAVFVLGLVLAELVPDDVVARRLDAAADRGRWGVELAPDGLGGFHDGFTECVALGVGLGTPPEPMGPVARALWAPRIGACDEGVDQVAAIAAGDEVPAGPYFRYWNGAAVLVRPVVALAGVTTLRVVAGLVLGAGAIAAGWTLGRRIGWPATAALGLPLLVGTNALLTPAGSLTHALTLGVALGGTAVVAVATDRAGWRGAAIGAAGAAAAFVYVDLLTTPAAAWALAAFAAGAVALRRRDDTRDLVAAGLAAGVAWPTAYAATWASRWLLAAAVHGRGVLDAVAEVSRFRVSGEFSGVQDHVGAATRANLGWWLGRVPTAPVVVGLALLVCLAAVVVVARRRHGVGTRLGRGVLLAGPALLVPAWYELLSNHSQIHAFFTYRSVAVAVGVGTAACALVATPARQAGVDASGTDAGDTARTSSSR